MPSRTTEPAMAGATDQGLVPADGILGRPSSDWIERAYTYQEFSEALDEADEVPARSQ